MALAARFLARIFKRPALLRLRCNCTASNEPGELDKYDSDYNQLVKSSFRAGERHSCYIIHPYVKWGGKKLRDTDSARQIEEAVALIKTLSEWKVQDVRAVPLMSLEKNQLFGSGTLSELTTKIRSDPRVTAVFVNMGSLKNAQQSELERAFRVPVFDRFKIVIQILKAHATSKHAKLQVALAEVQYLQANFRNLQLIYSTHNLESRKLMLQEREAKIKAAIKKVHLQREVSRNKRRENEIPIVAVVGYTNAGKTSLIKALTGDEKLVPRDELFATLDVTHHLGLLPSKLKVLYVDTVGFISDIPTTLIECFIVTLEDAIYADVILQVEDLSSEDLIHQRNHVQRVLESLSAKSGEDGLSKKLIRVGNKCDAVKNLGDGEDMVQVSAKTLKGVEKLKEILDRKILQVTDKFALTIRVPAGGEEMRWLYKNSAVNEVFVEDPHSQSQHMKVVIGKAAFKKFKHTFLSKK